MKRYGGLWPRLLSWENLLLAARKAQRGKRDKAEVQRFNFCQEAELLSIQSELDANLYEPGRFRTHWISEPKPRLISAAPYRDRVVHHALMNVLEPILERHFHPHSYACRRGKGTHAAADRAQELLRRYRYVVHGDVRKFFPSLDHEILKAKFRGLIKDRRVLELMDLVVDSSNLQEPVQMWFAGDTLWTPLVRRRGLPIGNLTSQWFGNWYLNALDYFVTNQIGIRGYARYCDDFLMADTIPSRLHEAIRAVKCRLEQDRLRLHETRLCVIPSRAGLRFVGYRIWPTHRWVPKENIRRFRRRLRWIKRSYAERRIAWEKVTRRLNGWLGHVRQANGRYLVDRLSRDWVFRRR